MERINLAPEVRAFLSPVDDLLREAGQIASALGKRLFLVGGVVRDILLGRKSTDIDITLEGDALEFASHLPWTRISSHPQFGTVKLKQGDIDIDIACARAETYPHPGSLPRVRPSAIEEDLARRDFTINAMAVSLSPTDFGELFDPYQGRRDAEEGIIQVLHEKSFQDDASRMLRALRYKGRLGFEFSPLTLSLILKDRKMLHTISGDRIRREIECWLSEEEPEKIFSDAHELGVLKEIYSGLSWNEEINAGFRKARKFKNPSLYLALLTYHLSREEGEEFIRALKLPRRLAKVIREAMMLKESKDLGSPDFPYTVWKILQGHSWQAVYAFYLLEKGEASLSAKLYLEEFQSKYPFLSGKELRERGVPPGPYMGKMLERIREARLSGEVKTPEEEENMVKDFLRSFPPP